jgi:hypothetical protein
MVLMDNKALILLMTVVIINGCSSYKPLEDGVFKVGYKETKLENGGYLLTYYGSDHDNEEDVEKFWHRRARELCSPAEYEVVKGHAGEWKSDGYVVLPPVLVAAENTNTTFSGEVHCKPK